MNRFLGTGSEQSLDVGSLGILVSLCSHASVRLDYKYIVLVYTCETDGSSAATGQLGQNRAKRIHAKGPSKDIS